MPFFLHPSWILGSRSGRRTPANTVLVPTTAEIVPHSIPFFVLAGTDLALLAIVPCSELVLRWFSSWPQIPFPKFSTSPSRAPWKCNLPVLFPDQSFHIQPPQNTSHLTRSSIFSLYQWLSPNRCLSCEEFHLWPLIIAKNRKRQENQKPRNVPSWWGSPSTIRFGCTIELSFSLFNAWHHWFYNILLCYSGCVVPYAIMSEFYYSANTITSINCSCNHIKIYP